MPLDFSLDPLGRSFALGLQSRRFRLFLPSPLELFSLRSPTVGRPGYGTDGLQGDKSPSPVSQSPGSVPSGGNET